jgi:hypothetical protein
MEHLSELPANQRVDCAPGLTVARRSFFATAATAFAAASLPGASSSWRSRQGAADWTIEQFLREVTPVAKELVADTSARGQDRYLLTLAAFAVRLGTLAAPELRDVGTGHRIGSHHGPDPFTVLHWQLQPNAIITPHAHTYGNVVTLGVRGSALVCNYEVVGTRDYETTETIEVVRTTEQVLRPGDTNLVSLERHYVHGFTAGAEGAEGLDITTRVQAKRKTPVLEVGPSKDATARTFAAHWRIGS